MKAEISEAYGKAPQTRQARRTRTALVRAARRTFETRGYNKTRLEDITDEAGYAAGSFYVYFDSKEEIFAEVLKGLGANLDGRTGQRPVRRGDVRVDAGGLERRTLAANERYFRSLATNGRLWAAVEEASIRDQVPRDILNLRWSRYREGVTFALRDWQEDGVVPGHIDLDGAVNCLSAMTEWLVTLRRVYGSTFPVEIGAHEATWVWMRVLTSPSLEERAEPSGLELGSHFEFPEPSGTTRERLIAAGLIEFSKHSVAKTRIADIARTAGLSVGSFYRHFPSKEDLLGSVLTSAGPILFEEPDSELTVDEIRSYQSAYVASVMGRVGLWRTVAEATLISPLVRAIVNEQRMAWTRSLVTCFERWCREAEVDPTIDVELTAVALSALTERTTHLAVILASEQPEPERLVKQLDESWRSVLRVGHRA